MIPDFKTFINESIWSDMQDRGNGTIEKKEDASNLSTLKPIDLGGSILWADQDLQKRGLDVFTFDEVKQIIKGSEWRLPTVDEAKELNRKGNYENNGWSFTEGDQTLYFTKRKYNNGSSNTYAGWTCTSKIKDENKKICIYILEDYRDMDDLIYPVERTSKFSARLVKDLPKTN